MEHVLVSAGTILAGKYRVERVLGQGGMGVVVKATHLQLHQPVAIKVLLPEMIDNPQIIQRFLREAQAAVRLKSEHVARVIDVGSLESGAPYMVLEYLEGTDLASFPRTRLPVGAIVDLMLQACEAIAEAHSLGIVHRDIKPANFFITNGADGVPLLKVLDFGISKLPVTGSQLTATHVVMGTPAYMSPEQMRSSRDVDPRSDIWALGIVLYELLQGSPPFGGDTFSSIVVRVMTEMLPPLTTPLPGALATVVYRCLERHPERRFQNVAELARSLAPYAQTATQAAISVQRTSHIIAIGARPGFSCNEPIQQALPSTLSAGVGERISSLPAGRRWPFFAGLGALLGVVVIAVVVAAGLVGRPSAARSARDAISAARPVTIPAAVAMPPTPPAATATALTSPSAGVTPLPGLPDSPVQDRAPAAPHRATTTSPRLDVPARTTDSAAGSGFTAVAPTSVKRNTKVARPKVTPSSGTAAPPPDDDVLGTRN